MSGNFAGKQAVGDLVVKEAMGSSSKVVRPEEVLESLKNDGSIDALRMKIIAQLKANVRARLPSSPDSPPIPLS